MDHAGGGTHELTASELLLADQGYGPLLQRDYWAVLDRCRLRPSELMAQVCEHFEWFAPPQLVRFTRHGPGGGPLKPGAELDVRIAGAVDCRVRVLHCDAQTLTLGTIRGHPEAGRITFGAYRNRLGDVVFHIRSRARSSSLTRYVGFVGGGESMQTGCWTDFINRVAAFASSGVVGWIEVETRRCEPDQDQERGMRPTFVAQGD